MIIFTDGSSRGNPGAGGWGAIVCEDSKVSEIGGTEGDTTNNRMELSGALFGLKEIGHEIIEPTASLVPIAIEDTWVKRLQG